MLHKNSVKILGVLALAVILANCASEDNQDSQLLSSSSSSIILSSSSNLCAGSNGAGLSFTDPRDRKIYNTVKIGCQTWMAENLNFEMASDNACYNNEDSYCATYGRLYKWETAMTACPTGWHLPSQAEWNELSDFVGGIDMEGKHLKAARGWDEDGNGLDTYGFAALPGGYGYSVDDFYYADRYGYWWSSTESNSYNAKYRRIYYQYEYADWHDYDKDFLFSVRCLQDD
jgi:uncharacterized protein (TIGR02145 family)